MGNIQDKVLQFTKNSEATNKHNPIIIRGSYYEDEEEPITISINDNIYDIKNNNNILDEDIDEDINEDIDELDFDSDYFFGEEKDNPIKDDGNFGVFLYQSILATIIAIAYTVLATVIAPVSENFLLTIKSLSTEDFSFSENVYRSVGAFFTYINEQKPLELNQQILSDIIDDTQIEPANSVVLDIPIETTENIDETSDITDTSNIQQDDVINVTPDDSMDIVEEEVIDTNELEAEAEVEVEAITTSGNIQELPVNVTLTPIIFAGDITFPISDYYYVTSDFGFRTNPVTKVDEFHTAYDLAANQGTNILAVLDGTVIDSRLGEDLGNFITIDHGKGLTTLYAHCHELLVKSGDTVKQGDVIAKVGNTGTSTGNHLHFAMKMDGIYFDPAYIFDKELVGE